MPNTLKARPAEAGFTLLELLIGLLIGGIVVGAGMQFYARQHYHLTRQMSISELQQNLRAAMQDVTDNVRMAGYGMPESTDPIIAFDTNPDTIEFFLKNSPNGEAPLEFAMPLPSAELRCDGHDLSAFRDSMWAYIFDPNAKDGEFFLISKVQYASSHIQHNTMPLSKAYPKESRVIAVETWKYYIDQSDSARPLLMRDRSEEGPQILSEGIEDLQFTYKLADGQWTDLPLAGHLVRLVQISMTARAATEDPDIVQGFRKRSLSTAVQVRNLGL